MEAQTIIVLKLLSQLFLGELTFNMTYHFRLGQFPDRLSPPTWENYGTLKVQTKPLSTSPLTQKEPQEKVFKLHFPLFTYEVMQCPNVFIYLAAYQSI